jgi:hypothetical protein
MKFLAYLTEEIKKNVKIPYELISRAHDVALENPSIEWFIEEAKYVVQMIKDGGSSYNDDDDCGHTVLKDMQKFLGNVNRK